MSWVSRVTSLESKKYIFLNPMFICVQLNGFYESELNS